MKLFFTRHGGSGANRLGIISNRDSPYGLTAVGQNQAEVLSVACLKLGIETIWASPIRRAVETAETVGRKLNLCVQISSAFAEFDCGELEERGDSAAWEAHSRIQREWFVFGNVHARIPGGESLHEIQLRFREGVGRLPPNSLVVTHGGVLCCALPSIASNITQEDVVSRGIDYTTIIEMSIDATMMRCTRWNGKLM